MAAVFVDHLPAAFFADDVGDFIFYAHSLQFRFRRLDFLLKARIELFHHRVPVQLSFGDLVQRRFHLRRKAKIHNVREGLQHEVVDDLAQFGGENVPAFLGDVMLLQNVRDRRRVGGRTAKAALFHFPDQRRFRIVLRRLGKMLLRCEALYAEDLSFRKP